MWSGTGPSLQQSSCQAGLGQLSSGRPFFSLKTTITKILKYYACKTLWKDAVIVTKTSTDNNASFNLLQFEDGKHVLVTENPDTGRGFVTIYFYKVKTCSFSLQMAPIVLPLKEAEFDIHISSSRIKL